MNWEENKLILRVGLASTDSRLRGNDDITFVSVWATMLPKLIQFTLNVIPAKAGICIKLSKKLLIFFICICAITISSIAANAATIEEANTFLKNQQYDEAIQKYESIVSDGYIGHELFFNLGTAYAKKDEVSKAVLNFEKALRIKPNDKLTKQQLTQLNLKLRDKPPIYEDTGLLAILRKIQFALSIDGWAFISVFLMLMVPISIYISYKYRQLKSRQLIFISSLLWFLLSGFSVIMARNCYHHKYLLNEAIIFPESIKVFDQPDNNSTILFNLHQGTKVEILDSTNNMYFVRYSEKKGWINNKEVEKIQL